MLQVLQQISVNLVLGVLLTMCSRCGCQYSLKSLFAGVRSSVELLTLNVFGH